MAAASYSSDLSTCTMSILLRLWDVEECSAAIFFLSIGLDEFELSLSC